MNSDLDSPALAGLRHELTALRGNWGWFVALGIALLVLGTIALGAVVVASLAATLVIGALILVSGVVETIGSFWSRAWSGFFLHLLSGVLSMVVGVLFMRAPVQAMAALTLLIAAFLLVGGVFKVVAAVGFRFAHWGWPVLSGVIDVVLGLLIWVEWPRSALWVIGLFVGISMIFRGVDWVTLGLALRQLGRFPAGPRVVG